MRHVLGVVVVLTSCLALFPVRAEDVTGLEAENATELERGPARWWKCWGPVENCQGPNGKTRGCSNAKGQGGEESLAKLAALQDCQLQLEEGDGSWYCTDDSHLSCEVK